MSGLRRGSRVRAAVVGAGLMGRWHAQELGRAGGAVVAVADHDSDAALRLARRHDGSQAYTTLEELLRETGPDVVHVCAPTESHAGLVETALEGGAHVLVEKPLAPEAETTERLLDRARKCGRLLCPVHQYVFQPGVERTRRALPRIGPLLHVQATACSAGPGEPDAVAVDVLPHPLAVLERFLPGGLQDLRWHDARLRRGELRASGDSGATTVSLCVSMNGRPTRNELRLIGAGGTAELDFFHGYAVLEGGAVSRARKLAHPFTLAAARVAAAGVNFGGRLARWEPAYPGLRRLIAEMYAAIRDGGEAPLREEEVIAVACARDALLAVCTRA